MDKGIVNEDELARLKKKIFAELPAKPLEIHINEIKDIFGEETPEDPGVNAEELRGHLNTLSGAVVRAILRKCLDLKQIGYQIPQLNKAHKPELISLFYDIFDIVPHGSETPEQQQPEKQPAQEKPSDSSPEPETPSESAPVPEPMPKTPRLRMDFSTVQDIYDHAVKIPAENVDPAIDMGELKIFDRMPITVADHLDLALTHPEDIYKDLVFLVNSKTGQVAAIGHLENFQRSEEGARISPHLVFSAEDIDYDNFKIQRDFDLALIPAKYAGFFKPGSAAGKQPYSGELYILEQIRSRFLPLADTERVLCIDFGTSNTTAGTYGVPDETDNSPRLVHFQDVTEDTPTMRDMMPTMVYVESCGNGKPPVYKFGYEAKKELIVQDYVPRASFFFEIKRWLNSMDEKIEIGDSEGNLDEVSHGDIVFAYLKHVIHIAEQQFKRNFLKLHFTAPVRQKDTFLQSLAHMFSGSGKTILSASESIDEGVAIIYHALSEELAKKESQGNLNLLIMDCGGGTTDLANCKCSYKKTGITTDLEIQSSFENGDSNFGGNNITYLVLQMIKIKIASKISGKSNYSMLNLVDLPENDILFKIDNSDSDLAKTKDEIYKKLTQAYDEAEKYIPTRFAEDVKAKEKKARKRNFYYLWQIAEAVKIEFYKSDLANQVFDKKYEDKAINLCGMDHYYLMVRNTPDAPLEKMEKPLESLEITCKEIDRILCPDIYALMHVLLNIKNLRDFRYRLSGQSCKISLFHDLLKEFIPGKDIRKGQSSFSNRRAESSELKKYCIIGSIEFNRDRDLGFIKQKLLQNDARHIYDVYCLTGAGPELVLGPQEKDALNAGTPIRKMNVEMIPRPDNTKFLNLEIRDSTGVQKNHYTYHIDTSDCDACTLQHLKTRLAEISTLSPEELQEQVINKLHALRHSLGNDEFVHAVFCLPNVGGYGMRVCQITTGQSEDGLDYWFPDPVFVPYENEDLQTFFDGRR